MYTRFRTGMFVVGVGMVAIGVYKLFHHWHEIAAGQPLALIAVAAPIVFGGALAVGAGVGRALSGGSREPLP